MAARKPSKVKTGEARLRHPVDITKFKKSLTDSMTEISIGFRDPKVWVSTGNYTLNKLISNDFTKGVPLGKVTVFAGESGAGKSYLAAGNIVRDAQRQGIFVVMIDSENALDKGWVEDLGVDSSEENIFKINAAQIDDVAKIFSYFLKQYKEENVDANVPEEKRQKVLFVVDSLGALLTPTESEQFEKGEMKGDMGIKAKRLKALVNNLVNKIGSYDIGVVATNHVYANQDVYSGEKNKVSGGMGVVYQTSIMVEINKGKLKEDADGNKITDVQGIRAMCNVTKSRFSKPFEKVTIKIPYDRGMDPYSGLAEYFEKRGLLVKSGNKLVYADIGGTEHKYFRKEINRNKDGILDLLMKECPHWDEKDKTPLGVGMDLDEEDDDDFAAESEAAESEA